MAWRVFLLLLFPASLTAQDLPAYVYTPSSLSVVDTTGTPYLFPFLGGLYQPKPQFLDTDGDGDLDLLLQRGTSDLLHFERTGPSVSDWQLTTLRFASVDPGFWFRLGDLDGDGDQDLVGSGREGFANGLVRVYDNIGSDSQPDFAQGRLARVAGTDQPLQPAFSYPELADLDCDGIDDLFWAEPSQGGLTYYQNRGQDKDGRPQFELVSEAFGDFVIFVQDKTEQHGFGSARLFDSTGDGLLDLFWGDEFAAGLFEFTNIGSCTSPAFDVPEDERAFVRLPEQDPIATSGFNVPEWADIDLDGDLDLLVGVQSGFTAVRTPDGTDNLQLFLNNEGRLRLETSQLLPSIDVGEDAVPGVVGLAPDGRATWALANRTRRQGDRSAIQLFHPTSAGYELADADFLGELNLGFDLAIASADLDADGDRDLLIGEFEGTLNFVENENGTFRLRDPAFQQIDVGNGSAPALGDLDGDGDLDLLVGSSRGTVQHFEQTSNGFALRTEKFLDLDLGDRTVPSIGRLNEDQWPDLLIGSTDTLIAFLGTSTGWKPSPWPAGSPLGLDLLASGVFPALAPVRSETQSRDDILAGLPYGGVMLFEPSSRAVSTDPALPEAQRLFFAAYPNPTGRELHVETSTQLRLTLYDVLGRRVDQWLMERFRIELQLNVPPGLYFLHGEAKDGKQQTISFVVGSS